MMKILLFGGTTEGRLIAQKLLEQEYTVTISVATEYGEELIKAYEKATILMGRLDEKEIVELLKKERFDTVIDATHPYATAVTENILRSSNKTNTRYIRVLREEQGIENTKTVENIEEAIVEMEKTTGNILVTTGSKELFKYKALKDYQDRLYVRVLPTIEALESCAAIGILQSHIIAMQGPFSQEINKAFIEHCNIKVMVSKSSGDIGGFIEKQLATKKTGVALIVIKRPMKETGYKLTEILDIIEKKAI